MEIDITTGAAVLTIVSPKFGTFRVLIDVDDWEREHAFNWYVAVDKHKGKNEQRVYFRRSIRDAKGKRAVIRLHRSIMKSPVGYEVDHRFNNYLDLRKSQLQVITTTNNQRKQQAQVVAKSSKYKGVAWKVRNKKWVAQISVNKKKLHIGLYDSEVEAALAYDQAARKHFGQFAALNFPEEGEYAA